ncbi:MAG: TIGR03905 family TSCPD domain-containing protein [Clostridia bacterium]|nr:TIGR03905 family TSCPD domain-containing protein [Clostridia bacterium]
MISEYTNRGVCSRKTVIDLADDGTINDIRIVGGCNGNTSGLAKLLVGMNARDAIERMRGIDCNGRGTSCPDQVAKALTEALKALD